MDQDQKLRTQIIHMLKGEDAHANLDTALKDIPEKIIGIKSQNIPYSIWQLTEHIRITQWDIVEFSRNDKHISPKWPDEYWPKEEAPLDIPTWKKTLKSIKKDRNTMIGLIKDSKNDLYKPFAHGQGQTLLREVLLIIDHCSYHTGQIILIRKLLNAW